jgi:hypothetical protein
MFATGMALQKKMPCGGLMPDSGEQHPQGVTGQLAINIY